MKPTANSSSPRLSRRSRSGEQCPGNRDGRDKPGHDEGRGSDTLLNPAARGHMVTCWQNGRRVLMHSSEVARMMKKVAQNPSPGSRRVGAVRANDAARGEGGERQGRERDEGPGAGVAPHPIASRSPSSRERGEGNRYDLTPPQLVPRSRTLAGHEVWQKLAKEMARVAGHPKRCHKSSCRRAKQCAGGQDACYLREFETVDVVMQRFLQSHARELRAAAQEGAGPAERDGAKP